jgi:hypothetical protein
MEFVLERIKLIRKGFSEIAIDLEHAEGVFKNSHPSSNMLGLLKEPYPDSEEYVDDDLDRVIKYCATIKRLAQGARARLE